MMFRRLLIGQVDNIAAHFRYWQRIRQHLWRRIKRGDPLGLWWLVCLWIGQRDRVDFCPALLDDRKRLLLRQIGIGERRRGE